jgi:hypothetical protein
VFDDQHVVRLQLDRPRDALAVLRAMQQRAQDQQIERALQVCAMLAVGAFSYRHSTQALSTLGSNVNPS